MHEYQAWRAQSGRGGKGGKVKKPQASHRDCPVGIGASKRKSKSRNKRSLAKSKRKEAKGRTGQQEREGSRMSAPRAAARALRQCGARNAASFAGKSPRHRTRVSPAG
jgi:hypothetical protein